MICKNCGAKYNDREAKCPFCGTMNEKGSKRLFFGKLLGITDTIGDMSEQPKKVLVKNTVAALCVAAAFLLIGTSITLSIKYHDQRRERQAEVNEEKELVKRLNWENETFPMLDEWYEKGEYSSIRDFFNQQLEDYDSYNIYGWRHYSFFEIYDLYYNIEQYIKQEQNQDQEDEADKALVLENAMELTYVYTDEELKKQVPENPDHVRWGLTQEELVIIAGYKENAQMVLTDLLGMSPKEQESLHQECTANTYYSACFDYAKRMGW